MELIKIGKPCKYWLPSRKIKWTWSLFLCISLNCVRCVSPDKYVNINIPIRYSNWYGHSRFIPLNEIGDWTVANKK